MTEPTTLHPNYKDIYICLYKQRLAKSQVRYDTMAKMENAGWIFQCIANAKTIPDMSKIRKTASECCGDNTPTTYRVEKINEVFATNK